MASPDSKRPMISDVGTTPRKPLSPTKRLKLFENERGICCLCGKKIEGRNWIAEHKRALGLGGFNDPENRGVAHSSCAALKTNGAEGDLARIAKAKRSKMKDLGIKAIGPDRPIRSAPMPTTRKAAARKAKQADRIPPTAKRMFPGYVSATERSA